MKTAIVIGAGISGLASALRLQSKGYDVTIVEKNSFVGGKTSLINNGFKNFNLTATIPMLFKSFSELFNEIGEDIYSHLDIQPINPTCKAFFIDSNPISFYTDLTLLSKELNNKDFKEYLLLLLKSKSKYETLEQDFLNVKPKLSFKKLKSISTLHPFPKTYTYFKNNLSNENLIKALVFQSMYVGISPFESSSIFSILPLINNVEGLVYIKGGISSFVKSLHKLFLKRNGKIILDSPVTSFNFEKNFCTGITIKNKKTLNASLIVSTCDFPYTLQNLIPKVLTKKNFPFNNYEKDEMSCSTFILYLSLKKDLKNLSTHNILINKDFYENLASPFNGAIPKNPSLYIYKDSFENGITNLNILLRVPNLLYLNEDYWTKELINKLKDSIILSIENILKIRTLSSSIISSSYLTPVHLKNTFNNYAGSSYGISPKLSSLDIFRPQCKIKDIENLYFAGDSIHPGCGVSNVLHSAKIAVSTILNDLN